MAPPDDQRGGVRRESQARAGALDFTALPERTETKLAGLLLVIPDLIALGCRIWWLRWLPLDPEDPRPVVCTVLAGTKLTSTRRVSHVYDIAPTRRRAVRRADRAAEGHRLTTYSYRLEDRR